MKNFDAVVSCAKFKNKKLYCVRCSRHLSLCLYRDYMMSMEAQRWSGGSMPPGDIIWRVLKTKSFWIRVTSPSRPYTTPHTRVRHDVPIVSHRLSVNLRNLHAPSKQLMIVCTGSSLPTCDRLPNLTHHCHPSATPTISPTPHPRTIKLQPYFTRSST